MSDEGGEVGGVDGGVVGGGWWGGWRGGIGAVFVVAACVTLALAIYTPVDGLIVVLVVDKFFIVVGGGGDVCVIGAKGWRELRA